MSTALIGHTGFVGGNLSRQLPFTDRYNSSNIHEIEGRSYDLLVCAGASAAKWLANRDPAEDRARIGRLCQHLAQARAGRVVLISTVDVYPSPVEVDEDAAIDPAAAEPYGRHRLELEQFVRERFECTVVRLPGLFGHGLKKNVIFDFLNDNQVDRIHPGGVFQFYDVDHLARDLRTALLHRLELLNISAEPVGVDEVARICLGRELCGAGLGPAPRYDYRSRHARLFGGRDGYTYSRAQVLADLRRYVAEVRVMQA